MKKFIILSLITSTCLAAEPKKLTRAERIELKLDLLLNKKSPDTQTIEEKINALTKSLNSFKSYYRQKEKDTMAYEQCQERCGNLPQPEHNNWYGSEKEKCYKRCEDIRPLGQMPWC